MKYIKHIILYSVCVMMLLWIIGFCGFCFYAVSLKYVPDAKVDAVVVLTGGTDRIDSGIQQMNEKELEYILISGVNKIVSEEDILDRVDLHENQKMTLGYYAENTAQNGLEVADWVQMHGFKSVLLVTSFYHMPRAIFEIHKHQDVSVVPYPVFPKTFNDSVDWVKTKYAWFLFLEYNKFIVVHMMDCIRRIFS